MKHSSDNLCGCTTATNHARNTAEPVLLLRMLPSAELWPLSIAVDRYIKIAFSMHMSSNEVIISALVVVVVAAQLIQEASSCNGSHVAARPLRF